MKKPAGSSFGSSSLFPSISVPAIFMAKLKMSGQLKDRPAGQILVNGDQSGRSSPFFAREPIKS
jgi:hypothetical protein